MCVDIQHLLSCFWLTSLCMIDSKPIHFHFFLWVSNIPLYICPTSSLFFHLSVDNHSISEAAIWSLTSGPFICKASNGNISLPSNLSLAPNLWLPLCSLYVPILFKGIVWLGLAYPDNLTFLKSMVLHNNLIVFIKSTRFTVPVIIYKNVHWSHFRILPTRVALRVK